MTPFDKSKSSSSSKGLEVREILLSEVLANKDARIDSQFFTMAQPKNPKLHYRRFGELLVSSEYGLSNEMNEDGKGYPIYRMNEMHSMLCDLDVAKCADINASEAKEFLLKDGDLLFNRTNSYELVGRCGVFYGTERGEKVFASYLVRLNTNKDLLLPECAAALLNTRYGVQEIRRRARQSINQTNVNPEEVKEIEIPIFEMGFQLRIRDAFRAAYQCLLKAEEKYKEAEAELLAEIGFASWQPTKDSVSVKKFSDAVNAGRIDAEYFQPKFDAMIAKLRAHDKELGVLKDFVVETPHNFKATGEGLVNYLEIGDVNVQNGEYEFSKVKMEDLPANAKVKVAGDEILVSLVRPTRGAIAVFSSDVQHMGISVCSGAFYVCKAKDPSLSEVIWLYLRCMRSLFEKNCKGTSYPTIELEDVANFPVPHFGANFRSRISNKVRESFRLRNEAKRQLEGVKKLVEDAIGQS